MRHYPGDDDAPFAWAHASGWSLLPDGRQRISCVVTTRNDIATLRVLLPLLSDVLTETGHAWELIAVDVASVDETQAVLRGWCRLPGYRLIVLEAPVTHDRAIVAGVEAARGDAVIVLDARIDHPLHLIAEMIVRWELGYPVIYAMRDAVSGESVLRWSGHHGASCADGDVELRLFEQPGDLVLMDRDVVRDLLR